MLWEPIRLTLLLLLWRMVQVSAWYTLVIFTASMQEYADPVIDWLDAGTGILERRLFREVSTLSFIYITLYAPASYNCD